MEYFCDAYPIDRVSEKSSSPEDQCFSVEIRYTEFQILNGRKFDTADDTKYYSFNTISKDEMMQETTILGWLSSIGVPSDAHMFMVAKILARAHGMALFTHKENKVLYMRVDIIITKDYVSDNDTDDDDSNDDDDEDDEVGLVPASNSSIEALKTIKEEEGCVNHEICSICLDDIEFVNVQMPCLHKFHRNCIVDWLKISGVCPLCRSQL